jgi:hypothetical protein
MRSFLKYLDENFMKMGRVKHIVNIEEIIKA